MEQLYNDTSLLKHPVAKWSVKVVLPYVVLSLVYIYASDNLLALITNNGHLISEYQTFKGICFVIVTGLVMLYIAKGNIREAKGYYEQALQIAEDRSKEHLDRSEQKYQILFDHIPLPMWIYDHETLRFLKVNKAATAKYGYTEQEFCKMTLKDIRPPEDIVFLGEALKYVAGTDNHTWAKPFRHRRKDDTILYAKIESTATTFNERKARLVLAMDITSEIEVQQDLKAANKMLRTASEMAGLGYWSNDLLTGKIHWSEELYGIFEVDPTTFELSTENIQNCFHPDHRAGFSYDLDAAFPGKEIKEAEHMILTPAGEKWILQRIMLERNEEGKPVMLKGVALDITGRKKNERSLEESNLRYKMVMEASGDAIVDWDINNNMVYWGESFYNLFGYDISKLNSRSWINYIHPEDKDRVISELRNAMNNKWQERFYTRYRFLKADAQIAHVKHKSVFVRNAHGRVVRAVGAMIDTTEAMRHLQFIERQNASLREIAWVQSHVVRGPLSTLMGLVNLLKDHEQFEVSTDELVPDILATANKLDDVIKSIVQRSESVSTNAM